MAYWLLKTEPDCYAWDDLARDKKTAWDGVTNALALKHIRTMKKGDLALIYHTGDERAAVGVAEVISAPYPDPKAEDERLVIVDVKPGRSSPAGDPLRHQGRPGFRRLGPAPHRPAERRAGAGGDVGTGHGTRKRRGTAKKRSGDSPQGPDLPAQVRRLAAVPPPKPAQTLQGTCLANVLFRYLR